mgnify:FL=1
MKALIIVLLLAYSTFATMVADSESRKRADMYDEKVECSQHCRGLEARIDSLKHEVKWLKGKKYRI